MSLTLAAISASSAVSSILLRLSSRAFLLTSLSLTLYCSCRSLATFVFLALGNLFLSYTLR